jgi:Tfp pilus assembly protein PilZ
MVTSEGRMAGIERRRQKRKKMRSRVMLKSRWQLATAVGVDVSISGVLIETPQPFSVGDDIELAIELPDNSRINCSGRVMRELKQRSIRVVGTRYGILITKIEPEAAARLQAWVDKLPS